MAKNETRRLTPSDIQADKDALAALKKITTYAPANANFTLAKATQSSTDMVAQQDLEVQADAALKTERDKTTAAEWAFHNMMLGVKTQVIAQFGEDSNEIQALGLKKKSEYKRPSGRPKKQG